MPGAAQETPTVQDAGALKENLGPFSIGIGVATLAICYPFMGVALGYVESTEPVHWAMRTFLFFFCLPFVAIGAFLVAAGFILLVNRAVPGEGRFVLRAASFLVRQALRPWHVLAALPVAFILVQYWYVMRTGTGLFGIGADLLEAGILIEFMAIHATGFLGVVALMPTDGRLKLARAVAFVLLGSIYFFSALSQGWDTVFVLAYLIAVKIGPFLLSPPDMHTLGNVGLRWAFQMCVFLSCVSSFGGLESLRAGAVYWTAITFAELFGMMDAELFAAPELAEDDEPSAHAG